MATISIYAILVVAIILIARYFGSPKLGSNLLLTLAFSVVVGLGTKFVKSFDFDKQSTKKESITMMNQQSMQTSNVATFVTTTEDFQNGSAGQTNNWFIINGEELRNNNELITLANTRVPPEIVNDS